MKKFISFLMICLTLVAFSGCGNSEAEEALDGTKWYYNGGFVDAGVYNENLRVLEFSEGNVALYDVTLTGNGVTWPEPFVGTYKIDNEFITVSIDGYAEIVIAYVLDGNEIDFVDDIYFSEQEVENGIQGHWMVRFEDDIFGGEHEYHISFENGRVKFESAAEALNGAPGEYYLGGPYEGTYELVNGWISNTMDTSYEFGVNIWDGKVTVFSYTRPMAHFGDFPGEDGYEF